MMMSGEKIPTQEELQRLFNQLIADFKNPDITDEKRKEIATELKKLVTLNQLITIFNHTLITSPPMLSALQEAYEGFSTGNLVQMATGSGLVSNLSIQLATSVQTAHPYFPERILLRNLELKPYDTLVALGNPMVKTKVRLRFDQIRDNDQYTKLTRNDDESLLPFQHLDLLKALFNSDFDISIKELYALADAGNVTLNQDAEYNTNTNPNDRRSGDALLIMSRRFAKTSAIAIHNTGPHTLENFINRTRNDSDISNLISFTQRLSYIAITCYSREELHRDTISRAIDWMATQPPENVNMFGLIAAYQSGVPLEELDLNKRFGAEEVIEKIVDLSLDKKDYGSLSLANINVKNHLYNINGSVHDELENILARAPLQYDDH